MTMFSRSSRSGYFSAALRGSALLVSCTISSQTFAASTTSSANQIQEHRIQVADADSACAPHKIDIGDGKSVTGGCGSLKIAYLSPATNNVYLQSAIQGILDAAKSVGANVEVFDSNWNAATQYNQTQNVISSGKFNAIVAQMVDGNQACAILTKDASAKNLLVAVNNQPLCDRAAKEGDELWAPGTLTFVGGTQGHIPFRDWLFSLAEKNPGPQRVAFLTGPDLNANTINFDLALKDLEAKYPDFQVVAITRTDYSVLQGNQKALPLLQAHPDLTILVCAYSDITRGALEAGKQAGMEKKVKIYDNGGNKWNFHAIEQGDMESTRMTTPYTEAKKTVEALASAWKGNTVPRYIPLESATVDKTNLQQYKPEY